MKIHIREYININNVEEVKKGDFVEVSEELGIFLTRTVNGRGVAIKQKAVKTGFFSSDNLTKEHRDLTHL